MTVTIGPEQPLPANPNCVSFAADAHDILVDWTWADMQQLGIRTATAFHQASGLAALVGYSWRVALDRKNHRHVQILVYFVFDGPATADHLDTLETSIAREAVHFGVGSIERVPANGVKGVLLRDGIAHLVLDRDDDGVLWFRVLQMVDGKVKSARVDLAEATPRQLVAYATAAVGVPAPYGDEEQHTERMRLAFARHYSIRIVEADGVVREGEEEFMASVFPPELLQRLAMTDPEAQAEYLDAARESLAGRLGHHDKLGLVGLFFSACYSDGTLDAREMRVLKEAGECLGLTREEVVKYLRRFW